MTGRVDIDALAEGAYAFCDPQFDEEAYEERCQKEDTSERIEHAKQV